MSFRLNSKLAITFLLSLAFLLAFATPSANAMAPDSARRHDHRMIKMRAAAPPVNRQLLGNDPGAIGAGANPPADSSTPSTPSSTPSSPSPSNTPLSSSAAAPSQPILSTSSSVSSPAVSRFPFTWRSSGRLIRQTGQARFVYSEQ